MRVYFLGAGASKSLDSRLPLASELTLKRLLCPNSYEGHPAGMHGVDINRLHYLSAKMPEHWKTEPIDFLLDQIRDEPDSYNAVTVSLLRQLFFDDSFNTSLPINWLRDVRTRGDVILTTNYDILIERCVKKLARKDGNNANPLPLTDILDFGVGDSPSPSVSRFCRGGRILLLKLHGSIAWSYCSGCGPNLGSTYNQGAEDALEGPSYCSRCRRETERYPIIVLDKPNRPALLEGVWEQAQEVLQAADEIVFAGFSLNPTEHQVRELLRGAYKDHLEKGVVVVDPECGSLSGRFREIYGEALRDNVPRTWNEYLVEHFS